MKRCINELMFYGRRVHRRFTPSFSSVCCETLIKLHERLHAELRGEKTRAQEQLSRNTRRKRDVHVVGYKSNET